MAKLIIWALAVLLMILIIRLMLPVLLLAIVARAFVAAHRWSR